MSLLDDLTIAREANEAAAKRRSVRLSLIRWRDGKAVVENALAHLIAAPIARQMVERELRTLGVSPHQCAAAEQVIALADGLLDRLPFKTRHARIRTEIADSLRQQEF